MRNIFITTALCLTVISSLKAINIPSPPEILDIECKRWSAILSWSPTGNEEVNEYRIQYKTNWSPHNWKDYGFKIPVRDEKIRLILSPWANYTFRVLSMNNAGASNHSGVSDTCATEEDVPYMNPKDVYGRGNGPKNLVITWKPMPPMDQNAPGFFYTVYWRLNDVDNSEWHHRIIHDWQQHRLIIEDLPKLRPYKIRVEAHNSLGRARLEADEVIGFSDEDRPSKAPKDLRNIDIRDGKSAHLQWEAVPPLSINGHFKGYKVQVWTDSSDSYGYENKSEQIVAANITTALIDIFTPGVINNVQVLAYNGAYDGPASNVIKMEMPIDVYPDPPGFVWTRITDQNNRPVIRIDYEPNVTNKNPGEQIHIEYRVEEEDPSNGNVWQNTVAEGIEDTKGHTDLYALEFDKYYEIRVVAKSGKLSSYSNVSLIDTSSKKWPKPTTTTTPTPPTPPPTLPPFIDSNHEFTDSLYERPDGIDNANKGLPQEVTPDSDSEGKGFSKTPWFIALICVLAFIGLFVGVFMYLKHRRSGGHEVNRNKTRVKADNIRTTSHKAINNANQTTDPKERNSFIVNVEADRNGSIGHDEGDDDDHPHQHREVYNGTTEANH